ncbi:MAG: DinB family protein [SAR202 cluster bacterium]|nr:DinB family protein [SAR202 cluster bacterium]
MATNQIADLVKRMEEAQKKYVASMDGITDRELYTIPKEGEWSVAQICAHMAESAPMWMEKVANAAKEPSLARNEAEQARRVKVVDEQGKDKIDVIRKRVLSANAKCLDTMKKLKPEDLTRPITGRYASPLDVVETSVIKHLNDHAQQITETRAAAKGK